MKLEELENAVPQIAVGQDYAWESDSGRINVDIWWHSPAFNVGWYPIFQVDYDDGCVFHKEGSENPAAWADELAAVVNAVRTLLNRTYFEICAEYDDHYEWHTFLDKDDAIRRARRIISRRAALRVTVYDAKGTEQENFER